MESCIVFFESQLAYLMYRTIIDKYHVKIHPCYGMLITEKMMADALSKVIDTNC
ncbi:MAG: hypothetical protein MSH20_00480 [Lachnospiraceae bacterium]|nr:hypothetical protein [Lachnospiraceae bacterium]